MSAVGADQRTGDKRLSYPAHAKSLALLGLPLIGGHLAQFSIGLTDTLFLGRYSVEALAAVTIASALFVILLFLGGGFASAVMPLVASFSEADDREAIGDTTRAGILLSLGFCVLVTPLLWWSSPVLQMLGQSEEVAQAGQEYLRIAGWGLYPALVASVLRSFVAALQRSRVVLWMSLLSAGTNAIGNYFLIFGHGGAPELGLAGAAIASLATNFVAMVGLFLWARQLFPDHSKSLLSLSGNSRILREVFRIGWPIGLTSFAECSLFVASAMMMGWLGTEAVAAHGVVMTIATATFMVHLGIGNAATIDAGQAHGQENAEHLRRGAKVIFLWSWLVSAFAVMAFLVNPEALVELFLDAGDPRHEMIVESGVRLLYLAALFQFMDGTQVVSLALLRGMLDTKIPLFMATFSYWLVGVPASYLLGFSLDLGARGVWMGLCAGLTCSSLLLGTRFWKSAGTFAE